MTIHRSVHVWLNRLLSAMIVLAVFLNGCNGNSNQTSPSNNSQTKENSEIAMSNLPQLNGQAAVQFTVNGSPIEIKLKGDKAPITAGNFLDLVQRGFYDGLTFHRVVKEPQPFVVQGGDPKGNGTGGFVDPETGERRSIPLEILPKGEEEPIYGKTLEQAGVDKEPELKHKRSALSMARSQMPNSASSQFFIALAELPFLDGDYAVFGEVTSGMDAVDNIQKGDSIESTKVISGLDQLQKP